MGWFGNDRNKKSVFPDYRDNILYNGKVLFKATGIFSGTNLEMCEVGNETNKIHFNTNVPETKYREFHSKYELFRFKDSDTLAEYEISNGKDVFFPTGRWFENTEGKLWEFMKKDNPRDVTFMKMPSFTEDQFNIGEKCL